MSNIASAQEVVEARLDNGLLVLLKENHNAPVVNLNVVYRVGSKYERPGITGISHLLEHMMFKTTSTFPLGEFDKRLKSVGADNNAYTWLDQTVYHETIAAADIEVALELEADRMRNLLCLPIDHELEMPVVRNELEQRDDSPFTLLYEDLISNAFKAHPYQVPTIGWVDDVEGITTQQIKEYYDTWYHPDNAFIVAVGDFDSQQMLERIRAHFGSLPSAGVRHPRLPQEPEQIGEKRFEINRAGQVDYQLIGWKIPESEHPDAYALVVLGNILGSGRTSRLYKALVDSGVCTSAGASSSAFGYSDPFLFIGSMVMNPGQSLDTAEQTMYDEIAKVVAEGVTDEELARAKKQARVSFVFDKDSIESEAAALVDFELMSSWQDLFKYLPGIEAVSSDDVKRVAATYLVRNRRTVGRYIAIRPEGMAAGDEEYNESAGDDEMPSIIYQLRSGGGAPELPALKPAMPAAASAAAESAPAASLAQDEAGAPPTTVTTLPNGITVVVRENRNNSTISVHGLVRAGGITDPADRKGTASFAVSMLSRGTENKSKLQIAQVLEGTGIELGFGPSREYFTFSGRSLSEDFPTMLDMLAEQLLKPSFPENEIELLRTQTLSGLLESYDDTFDMSFYTARDTLYDPANPYAGRIDGTPESVKAITRGDLADWYAKNVKPQGAVITIVGDVDAAAAVSEIEKRFASWTAQPGDVDSLVARSMEFRDVAGQRRELPMPDKSNVSLLWMGPGVSKQGDDWVPRLMANFVFGGDFYSRLNERLRIKEGLTYGAFSWFSNGLGAGPWAASVQVNPQNVEPAIAATTEELRKMASAGITEEELELARNYLTGNFPVQLSTNSAVAARLTESVYLGNGVDYITRYPGLVRAVTKEQIDAIAAEYFDPARLMLVVAGTLDAGAADEAAETPDE